MRARLTPFFASGSMGLFQAMGFTFIALHIVTAMAHDRTMPHRFSVVHPRRQTPVAAVLITAGLMAGIILAVSDIAAAGAAASLIFLVTFALANWIAILARRRSRSALPPFRTPWFPVIPVLGTTACFALAVYQGVMAPSAGLIALVWLGLGALLFFGLFARPVRVMDASGEARDPEVIRFRGRSPLVLAPIVNLPNSDDQPSRLNEATPGNARSGCVCFRARTASG